MLLVAGKKMAGWSEVAKESGPVPAAEVAPYAWTHRFLPHEAKKVSSGGDERGKVPLPWLNLVATGGVTFKWTRFNDRMTITEDGKRAVCSVPWFPALSYACAVAEPQVTHGRHWFELQILNNATPKNITIGWSSPGVGLHGSYNDKKGCSWFVPLVYMRAINLISLNPNIPMSV